MVKLATAVGNLQTRVYAASVVIAFIVVLVNVGIQLHWFE
jgi:hypothetical protein